MKELMKEFGWVEPFIPMNAKDSGIKKDKLMKDDEYVAEQKFDGARYSSVNGRFFSRRLSVKDGLPVEKTNNVPHLSTSLSKIPRGTILDGEIYYPGKTSNDVTRVLGALPAKAIERQKGNPIKYMAFDIVQLNGEPVASLPWEDRRSLLEGVYNAYLKDEPHVDLSEVHRGTAAKEALLKKTFSNNDEGIMLKNVRAHYYHDKRPEHNWYKIKKHVTFDAVIMDFEPGKGKYEGQVGSIVYGQYDKKGGTLKAIGTTSGFTDAFRLLLTKNPKAFVGKVVELEAMEATEGGSYRHPQFVRMNTEKSPTMCIKGEF